MTRTITDPSLLLGWSDDRLLHAYQQTDGGDDPWVKALVKEIKRRNLDI